MSYEGCNFLGLSKMFSGKLCANQVVVNWNFGVVESPSLSGCWEVIRSQGWGPCEWD